MSLTKREGQRVLISGGRFHGAARIVKVNPKNIKIRLEDGRGLVNAAPIFLSDLAEGAPVPSRYEQTVSVDVPTQHPGAFIRAEGEGSQVFVVLADKFDKINAAKVGGDGGRYYRFPRGVVKPLSLEDVRRFGL